VVSPLSGPTENVRSLRDLPLRSHTRRALPRPRPPPASCRRGKCQSADAVVVVGADVLQFGQRPGQASPRGPGRGSRVAPRMPPSSHRAYRQRPSQFTGRQGQPFLGSIPAPAPDANRAVPPQDSRTLPLPLGRQRGHSPLVSGHGGPYLPAMGVAHAQLSIQSPVAKVSPSGRTPSSPPPRSGASMTSCSLGGVCVTSHERKLRSCSDARRLPSGVKRWFVHTCRARAGPGRRFLFRWPRPTVSLRVAGRQWDGAV